MERIVQYLYRLLSKTSFVTVLTLFFFFVPFLWLKSGEMDLGGDSSRLYFYDPLNYIQSQGLYSSSQGGFGGENYSYFNIPFIYTLALIKFVLRSPTLLMLSIHGLSLSMAFLFSYLGIKTLLSRENKDVIVEKQIINLASILGGIFYCLSPMPIIGWSYVILTYYQIFLNPLIFYLLFRFFLTDNFLYILIILCISFIFAPNFSFIAAPPLFAFYPLAILFLILYRVLIMRKQPPVIKLMLALVLFICIHSFHIIPRLIAIFSSGTVENQTIFSVTSIVDRGLGYFTAIAPRVKLSFSLLSLPQLTDNNYFSWIFVVFPVVFAYGLLWNKRRTYLLSLIIFLITIYFYTANITQLGLKVYMSLFQIPGFSMFRNFFGQWQWTYLFWYSFVFGQAVAIVMQKLDVFHKRIFIGFLFILFIISSFPFLVGSLADTKLWQSKDIRSHIRMDPEYEKVLSFIRSLPTDGRVISFPLTDVGYQILQGKDGGAYMGPSTITYLTNKSEIVSYAELGEFGPDFISAVRDSNYDRIYAMLRMFNVKYIFYNSDPYIYGENFPAFPYAHVISYMPANQKGYSELIHKLNVNVLADFGDKYHVYEIKDVDFIPHIFASNYVYFGSQPVNEILFNTLLDANDKNVAVYESTNRLLQESTASGILLRAKSKIDYLDLVPKPITFRDDNLLQRANDVLDELDNIPIPWDQILYNYERLLQESITQVIKIGDSSRSFVHKIKINQVLDSHASKIDSFLLNNNSLSLQDKITISDVVDRMFDQLKKNLDLTMLLLKDSDFVVDIPSEQIYEVFLDKNTVPYLPPSAELIIDDKQLTPQNVKKDTYFIPFGTIKLHKKQYSIRLKTIEYPSIIDEEKWQSNDEGGVNSQKMIFMLNNTPGSRSGLFLQVPLSPDILYKVSFDYNTHGRNYWFNAYEFTPKDIESQNISNVFISNRIRSQNSMKFTSYFYSGSNSKSSLLLHITPASDIRNNISPPKDQRPLSMNNISISPVTIPKIIFRKLALSSIPVQNQPEVTSIKLNSTKYKILIKNSSGPYELIFLEKYNPNWMLRFSDEDGTDTRLKGTYVSEQNHFRVNSYANAWHIDPQDTKNQKNYTFILEMKTQRIFPYLMIFSMISLGFCLIWMIMILYRTSLKVK